VKKGEKRKKGKETFSALRWQNRKKKGKGPLLQQSGKEEDVPGPCRMKKEK